MHYDISDQARETAALEARNSELIEAIRALNDNQAELAAEVERSRSLQAQLRRRAEFDSMSGLANRDSFYARCDEEMTRCRLSGARTSVTFLDIDGFKMINDTFGHSGGDAVIRKVGRILAAARRSGDFAGRIGGDEFAILLPGTSLDGALKFAGRVRARMARGPAAKSNVRIRFTASFGVAQFSATDQTVENLLERADKGLYAAKQRGRNCVVAWPSPEQGP
jgi:diguanylate cyclase (GGDEF)-like protein